MKRTHLNFYFSESRVLIYIMNQHGPKVRRQIALQLFRALKRELKEIRNVELDDERGYGAVGSRPVYGNLRQTIPEEAYVGLVIRLKRQKMNLTQLELAKKMGVSSRMIIRLEKGAVLPSVKNLWLLERELGLDLERLVRERERSFPNTDKI